MIPGSRNRISKEKIAISFLYLIVILAFIALVFALIDRHNFWPFYGQFSNASLFLYYTLCFGVAFSLQYAYRRWFRREGCNDFNVWSDLPKKDLARLGVAVFLIFSTIGPITCLMADPLDRFTWFRILLGTISAGGFSATVVVFGDKKVLLSIFTVLFALTISYTRKIDQFVTGGSHEFDFQKHAKTQVISTEEYRLVARQKEQMGLISLACIIGGYIMFITAISREGKQRLNLQAEIAVARSIQSSLNTVGLVQSGGVTIHHRMVSATDVGGDYVDVIEQNDNRTIILLADASGHGVGAGILSAITKGAIKALLLVYNDLPVILAQLNKTMQQVVGKSNFITMALVQINRAGQQVHIATAGHHPVIRISAGTSEEYRTQSLGLGIAASSQYSQFTIPLVSGDQFIIYSDGVVEAANKSGSEFGKDQLARFMLNRKDMEAAETLDALLTAISEFTGTARPADDLSVVHIRID